MPHLGRVNWKLRALFEVAAALVSAALAGEPPGRNSQCSLCVVHMPLCL